MLSAVAQRVAPLALDRLPLARGERGEKVVERGEAVAEEVELFAVAHQKTHPLEPRGVLRGREGDVDRRRLGLPPDLPQARDQRLAGALRRVGRDQQASPVAGVKGTATCSLG